MQIKLLNERDTNIYVIASPSIAYVREVVRGVSEYAARKVGWNVAVLDPGYGQIEQMLKVADGAITFWPDERWDTCIKELRVPAVCVSSRSRDSAYARVIPDNFEVGRLGAEHLLATGLVHFGYCGIPAHWYSEDREKGFRDVLRESRHQVSVVKDKVPSLREWLSGLPKPVGILAANDERAARLLREVKQLGLRIPEDVAIMGVDNDEMLLEMVRPTLTSIDVNARKVGMAAAELLGNLILGSSAPLKPIFVAPRGVVVRQSTDILNIDDPDVNLAVRFIRSNCSRDLSIQDIANELNVSRRWLERRFQEYLKRSPAEIMRQARVDRVKSLLANSEQGMAEIAGRAGFSSPQQMSRNFAELVGCSPSEYRKKLGVG